MSLDICVIGGGAAGFFAALQCAAHYPEHRLTILEKSPKLLSKVKVSGGGRCNVTHDCHQRKALLANYPRGTSALRQAFGRYMPADMQQWLEARGVTLKTEPDGRMFPTTDDSQTIIDCFLVEARKLNIRIRTRTAVTQLTPQPEGRFGLHLQGDNTLLQADRVIVCTGGRPQLSDFAWLADLGHPIVPPVPSLFTFNLPQHPICTLQGLSVPKARVRVPHAGLAHEGPLLITHWGLSAPAVLLTSAWGARLLHQCHYDFEAHIHWLPEYHEESLRQALLTQKQLLAKRAVHNRNPFGLPARLWEFLMSQAGIPADQRWADLSKAHLHTMVQHLAAYTLRVKGKTTFKEEFVTAGGVDLEGIQLKTMESKYHKGLFFAGEVLDIDGVTGGFNFQAAWSTAYVAALAAGVE
jgi:predicted Rossmann fold flavoprotein